ncbi:hypothetical protein [Actinomyces ruminis]|uniref:hypothetical protein n=1 Tax=Actinomyces ruminis TaxID=1937003 RepID=UPI00211DC2CD|nr:hypothetical protein [Actinomyces ruminis]
MADWIASTEDYFPLLPLDDDGTTLLTPHAHAARIKRGLSLLEIPSPWHPRDTGIDATRY